LFDTEIRTFRDVEDTSTKKEHEIEIPDSMLRLPEQDFDLKKTLENALQWIATNGFQVNGFTQPSDGFRAFGHSQNALTLMINALNDRQLNSISLTLDVVKALLLKKP
jgi:hypothetical protein